MATKARVSSGACGYTSVIKVHALDKKRVHINIITACRMVQSLNEELAVIDWTKGVFDRFCDSLIYRAANDKLKHTDCPVPMGIIKAIQVEIKGALPKDITLKFEEHGVNKIET